MKLKKATKLARQVFKKVLACTESFEEQLIGPDLAYLMGAILTNETCSWEPDRPLLKILKEEFWPNHRIWKYIHEEET
jgi:hypothetical protein